MRSYCFVVMWTFKYFEFMVNMSERLHGFRTQKSERLKYLMVGSCFFMAGDFFQNPAWQPETTPSLVHHVTPEHSFMKLKISRITRFANQLSMATQLYMQLLVPFWCIVGTPLPLYKEWSLSFYFFFKKGRVRIIP